MMKYLTRGISVLLAVLLVAGMLPAMASAAVENTPKEEVVYINLYADGSVKEIYVVNIFDLAEDGTIVDYGAYESLRNMTTTDAIGYQNSTVTIDASAGKLYYEGKLKSDVMPWNIQIRYYMDGTEYSAEEIAGKSGSFRLTLSITENTDCIGNFFEGYALQANVTLDTKKCSNIRADGATVANVGSDKQLTYTILPNSGANIEVTADVTDFEMSAISINGIKLNLSFEIDDTLIQEKIDLILNAIRQLDDGAGTLNSGAQELYDGTTLLEEKMGTLYDGVGALTSGAGELADGLAQIASQNSALLDGAYQAYSGICTAAATVLNSALTQYGLSTVTLTPENYAKVLTQLLKTMDADTIYDLAYSTALAEVTSQVQAQADALYAGYIEQIADSVYTTYIQSQAETVYSQVAASIVVEQLVARGFTEEEVWDYLETDDGVKLLSQIVGAMTDDQKAQILEAAVESLTDDQKAQIRAGAVASLTSEQKAAIQDGYIEQLMKSTEVTDQITAAVAASNSAAASVVDLKNQLDNYGVFYDGLKTYTSAVSTAASGAETLKINMDTLYENVGLLTTAVGELSSGAGTLYEGTTTLKDGTGEFVSQTDGISDSVTLVINKVLSSITGSDAEVTSFVSEQNTNVEAVQFVIQTEAIAVETVAEEVTATVEKLTFWQKLLRLFGLY